MTVPVRSFKVAKKTLDATVKVMFHVTFSFTVEESSLTEYLK